MLLGVVISRDRNAGKKEAEKILKYKELRVEIQRMWYVKKKSDTRNNTGKNRTIPNSFRIYLSNKPGKKYRTTEKKPYWALIAYFRASNVQEQNCIP